LMAKPGIGASLEDGFLLSDKIASATFPNFFAHFWALAC
jgi:hypothetical protein